MQVKRNEEKQVEERMKRLADEYYTLALVEENIDRKDVYLQKACEADGRYLEDYLKFYEERVALGDYKGAYAFIKKGENIALNKKIPVNMYVPKILLQRLLGKNKDSCSVSGYYGSKEVKGKSRELYGEGIYYIWVKDYELAYEIFYYLDRACPEYDFKTVLTLIEKNALKEWKHVQKTKK